jgi:DNA-binding phage protein
MALTRDFKETIRARALKDSAFRISLLEESVNEFLAGDLDTAKALLRDYVNASVSFEVLAQKTQINDKSLQRMLSDKGNPTTSNFCAVLHAIQEIEGVNLGVKIRH